MPNVKMINYKALIESKGFFDQPVSSDSKKYINNKEIRTGQGQGFTAIGLFGYSYFIEQDKVIAKNLSKQQTLDSDRKVVQINFSSDLEPNETGAGSDAVV